MVQRKVIVRGATNQALDELDADDIPALPYDASGAAAAAASGAASALATHDADTTAVHGIADTSTLYRAGGTDVAVADGGTGSSTAAAARTALGVDISTINFIIDGGGSAITTGIKGDVVIDFACTVTAWDILADQSGSIVVDIWKDSYANFPPVVGDTMTGAEKPTLSAAAKNQDTSLASGAGWAIAAGDVLRYNVDSAATVTRATIALKVVRA